MTTIYNIYDQIAEMLAQLEPEKILAMQAPKKVQQRFDLLVEKSKKERINKKEKDELDHFIIIERLFRLAKIKSHIAQQKQ